MSGAHCTLYVSSCDAYSDLWPGFFFFLKKRWPDCPFPITLSSESKTLAADGLDIRCPRFYNSGRKAAWGELQLRTLSSIDTPYILFMLDDFYISRRVDGDMIAQCLVWMDADAGIGKFMLRPPHFEHGEASEYPPFREDRSLDWRVNAQASLWRTELFAKSISPDMNVWNWESIASRRSLDWPERFFMIDPDYPDLAPIFYIDGGVLHLGQWNEDALIMLRRNGLTINPYERGVCRYCIKNPLERG
ncbi:MAG: hypothetical protein LBB86_04070 [Oscillospiraceae bacterium]|jgi:hypothetical protein|nr:hypothetical protein [Oscillospiraceae bacterium]